MMPFATVVNAAREFIAERQATLNNDTQQRYTVEDHASVEREYQAIETEIAKLTQLWEIAALIAALQYPRVEQILRRRGYRFEADRIAELVQLVTHLQSQK